MVMVFCAFPFILVLLVAPWSISAAPPRSSPSFNSHNAPSPPSPSPYTSYWDVHGLLFTLALLLYPRLTLLLAASFPMYAGPLTWIGWLLAPHLTVVVLGFGAYWSRNWIICLLAVPLALFAELLEKRIFLLGKDFR